MLHVALTLNRCCDVLVKFIPRQPPERIPLREACAEAFTMLIGAASEVGGNTGIKRTGIWDNSS